MSGWPAYLAALRTPDAAQVAAARAKLDDAAAHAEPGPATDRAATWSYPWPAGERFAAELAAVVDCRDLRVADLGCGRGHLGFSALACGAVDVLFADGHPDAVAHVAAAIVANGFDDRARAAVHVWGASLPDGPYDVILGGDVLYRPDCFAALIATIAESLGRDARCVLADPRHALEDELPTLARANRLTWSVARRAAYTVALLRRA